DAGVPITSGAFLAASEDGGDLYLVDNSSRRALPDRAAADLYGFDRSRARRVPSFVLAALATGTPMPTASYFAPLAGKRVRLPGDTATYLVDSQSGNIVRRRLPTQAIHDLLF